MSTNDIPNPEGTTDSPWPSAPPGTPGLKIGFPGAHEVALPARRFSHRATIVLLVGGLSALTLALIVVALLATPGPAPYCPPLKCQGPPVHQPGGVTGQSGVGPAVESGTLFSIPDGFSLRYVPSASVPAQTSANGIGLTYTDNTGAESILDVFGGTAGDTSPETAVEDFVQSNLPSATVAYQLPEPLVGYEPGYGEALNVQPASSDGSTTTYRVIVIAAESDGYGVVVVLEGALLPPVTSSSPNFNGHPSPADVGLAYFYGTDMLINSIRFP